MIEEMGKNPKGAGKSSFELIDLKKISDVLPVKPGSVVLDLARQVRPNISGCRKKRWMIWSWDTDSKKAANKQGKSGGIFQTLTMIVLLLI